ncbi:MAG TPA: M4 family metallopeptidase [Flavipsychrobacter sp.]|nr:M4 family metallopeptidase [Flavipsychrobacter sp.]
MRSIILSFFTIFTITIAFGQVEKLPGRSTPIYTNLQEEHIEVETEGAVEALGNYFQLDSRYSFQLMSTLKDDLGFTHYRYRQYCNHIPVEGSMWILHEKGGKIQSVNGDIFDIRSRNKTAAISEEAALNSAMLYLPATKYIWQQSKAELGDEFSKYGSQPKGELVYVPEEGAFGEKEFKLAYKFDIYAVEPLQRAYVFIDAQDGKPLWKTSRIHEISVSGTAATLYSGSKSIVVDSLSSSSFRLFDATRGNGIHTKNMNNGTSGSGSEVTSITKNYSSANNFVKAIYDAHWGAARSYDYFKDTFNRLSYDGKGSLLLLKTRYSNSYDNAFWNNGTLTFGDGNSFSPLTALDVVGHELTHGITEFTAGLYYNGESGALNESFSDIFGNCIDFINKPTATWQVGEEITAGGLRNMSDPNIKLHPDTYLGTHWITAKYDNFGVHINSGVQNYWFYLLSSGGSGINDKLDAYSVTGIGMHEAAKIAYRNLSVYLTPTSDHAIARIFAIQSARDLYGPCSNEVTQTTAAWYAVGVGNAAAASGASFTTSASATCKNYLTVNFRNTSAAVQSSLWYFGDGSTSTSHHPTHSYTQPGSYPVKLIVTHCDNSKDSVMVNAAVTVAGTNTICDTIKMNQPVAGSILCNAIVTDDGGVTGNYGNDSTTYLLFDDPAVSQYKITFISFNTENTFDYLFVYDGDSLKAPMLGAFTGNSLPNSGLPITTTSNKLLLIFQTDNIVNGAGFTAKVECLSVLPIELLDWTASSKNCATQLNWSVANSRNFSHFEIERSHDGQVFETIGRQVYSGNEVRYHFTDNTPGEKPGYYRLKLTDINGTFSYSKVLTVLPDCGTKTALTIFPNPAKDIVTISASCSIRNISVLSSAGKLVHSVSIAALNEATVNTALLPSGSYILQVTDIDGSKHHKMLIKE